MRELRGKVAVVTGAASGIGRALSDRFAREGMRLVLADVEEKPLAEACQAALRHGTDALAVATDVSDGMQVDALARRAFETFGAAHVLCNNAGVSAGGMTWGLSQADWEWVLGVNLWGVIHGIRAFVPRMIAQGEGHVVNTASIAGLICAPASAPYCASKHAVVAVSESLHYDLTMNAHKVRVSVLCPAWVKTKIADSERNRPLPLARARRGAPSPQEQMVDDLVRSEVAAGMNPDEVAEQVVQAIVEERFWVLTHPRSKKAVERRARGIVENREPVFEVSKL
jgi:NAD(P)-dependent dehydrogenase (short-subunit alcohol dehydrogenase family)